MRNRYSKSRRSFQAQILTEYKWPIEFADEHPSATVLGIDLSPIQPQVVPVNCSFRVDNVEDDWVLEENYDFIHSRVMLAAIKNWRRFIHQAFQ
jgi:Methyltransferase domain